MLECEWEVKQAHMFSCTRNGISCVQFSVLPKYYSYLHKLLAENTQDTKCKASLDTLKIALCRCFQALKPGQTNPYSYSLGKLFLLCAVMLKRKEGKAVASIIALDQNCDRLSYYSWQIVTLVILTCQAHPMSFLNLAPCPLPHSHRCPMFYIVLTLTCPCDQHLSFT